MLPTSQLATAQFVKVESPQDGVALVRLNRPNKRNALTQDMIAQLEATLALIDANNEVRALVIAGTPGGAFCGEIPSTGFKMCSSDVMSTAGVDLGELMRISTGGAYECAFLRDLTDAFTNLSKPIVAAVAGLAVWPPLRPISECR